MDGGAGFQQQAVHRLKILQRDSRPGQLEQRGPSPRKQDEHQVGFGGFFQQPRDRFSRAQASGGGKGMSAAEELHALYGFRWKVRHADYAACKPVAQQSFHRPRHRDAGFTRANDKDPGCAGYILRGEAAPNSRGRIHRAQCGLAQN